MNKVTFRFDFTAVNNCDSRYAFGQAKIITDNGTYYADINYFDETDEGDDYGRGFQVEINKDHELLAHRIIDLDSFSYRYISSPKSIEEQLGDDLLRIVRNIH